MTGIRQFTVDRDLVQREIEAFAARPRSGWVAKLNTVLLTALFFVLITSVVPAVVTGDLGRLVDGSAPGYWVGIGWRAGIGLILGLSKLRLFAATTTPTIDVASTRIENDWRHFTEGAWLWRTVRTGMLAGLAIGIPVGALIAFTIPESGAPDVELAGYFILLTMAWTIPGNFLLRWRFVRTLRRYIRASS